MQRTFELPRGNMRFLPVEILEIEDFKNEIAVEILRILKDKELNLFSKEVQLTSFHNRIIQKMNIFYKRLIPNDLYIYFKRNFEKANLKIKDLNKNNI